MSTQREKDKGRPGYPSVARQWQGIFLTIGSGLLLEVISVNAGRIPGPGGILLFVVLFATYWSGLRAGLICAALTYGYLLYAYATPHAYFEYTVRNASRLTNAAILFPTLVLLVGLVQGRLRNAAVREFDSKLRADAEESQRKLTESILRRNEETTRLVIDAALDGIVAIDIHGTITLWNASSERKFGWTADEIIGKKLIETIIPFNYREAHEKGFQRFLETGEANVIGKRLELTGLTKDGREFPIELSIAEQHTEGGTIFIGFVRDLTEQKKLNERLRQAQKMEAIGTLAGGIAHDFNNILTAIAGNLMLARHELDEASLANESLTEIEKSVKRATYVVRQILTFSRAEEVQARPINVVETLGEAIGLLKATIPASVEVTFHSLDQVSPIVADVTEIHQLVLNLGINAYQAMEGKPGKFEISVNQVEVDVATAESLLGISPGTFVKISARDTGCGMNQDTLDRIYDPFYTTKKVGEGTGLGLAVVYGIVNRYGGAITAYSEPEKGTVFHIYFPATEDRAITVEPEAVTSTEGKGQTILYVDDDEALVFMMTRMLTRLNYDVRGFSYSVEALDAFRADPDAFDLVITDMSMPQMDGPALVAELQQVRPDVPIVMVTGYIRQTDLERAKSLGIKELILKPNTIHEMSEVLHRILEAERASAH